MIMDIDANRPKRRMIGERACWRDAQDVAIDADGDAAAFFTPPHGGSVIVYTYREATVPPLAVSFTNWHDGWDEFRAQYDYITGGTDPDERCWNGFCVAGAHPRSARHVDTTGHSWTQPRVEA